MNSQQLEWNDIRLILAICQQGSLSGAARYLGINHSTVFRRLTSIEKSLNVRLFERINNSYEMTEAGETVLKSGQRIESEVQHLAHKLIGKDLHLSGVLRITAPDALLSYIIMPHIVEFSNIYPDIQLEINNANSMLDLTRRETDVAIRATNTPPETAAGKKLADLHTAVFASKKYLELSGHCKDECLSWLMPGDELKSLPANNWLRKTHPNAKIIMHSNSLYSLFKAVKFDMGVSPIPCFLGDSETTLTRVTDPIEELKTQLWILLHPDLRNTARVRAFIDFISEKLATDLCTNCQPLEHQQQMLMLADADKEVS